MVVRVKLRHLVIGTVLAATSLQPLFAAPAADPLASGFASPPDSARLRVWWHWMNGNITKDGILKDIQWMHRTGIAGLNAIDADLATPQIVEHRLIYMHSNWKDAFAYAARTADQYGLELGIDSSPGWSETAGPWVKPEDGMKKLVWSETLVSGGRRFVGKLPHPPTATGPFQTLPLNDPLAAVGGGKGPTLPTYYRDVAVFAVPVPAMTEPVPIVRAGSKALDPAALAGNDLASTVDIARGTPQQPTVISLDYPAPTTIRSATLYISGEVSPFSGAAFLPMLEAKVRGSWQKLASVPLSAVPTTVSFAPITAQQFRIVLGPNNQPAKPGLGEGAPGAVEINFFPSPGPDAPVKLAQLRLSSEARIDRFEAKAGFAIAEDYYALSNGLPNVPGVDPRSIINLTSGLRPDGTLDWIAAAGSWRIIRLGFSLLGTTNHPAPPEATGLEVDKMDGRAVRDYMTTYLAMYRDASGGLIGDHGVRAITNDSTEVGTYNWTSRMIDQFRRLRGYDPTNWLPTLTGTIVGSRDESDKFLYDYRRTIADLTSSEHYRTVAQVAHENHLRTYGEALEDDRPTPGDDMAMRRYADTPMAALWTWNRESKPRPTLLGDMKGASSIAHIYGQNRAAAESMTSANSPWAFAPRDLRRFIDLEFAEGINQPFIHSSVHQPTDDKFPGLSLAIFGQYFNRHETWAEMAKPWVDYISRNSYMLQQGRDLSDIAYFYGEEAPLTALFAHAPLPDLPTRYAYDFVNPDVLINQLHVDNGELFAKSGARYKILYLGGTSRRMTLPVIRRLAELVTAGATVVGSSPDRSPSLKDDPVEFGALRARLWSGQSVTRLGKGRVIVGSEPETALLETGVLPDFAFSKPEADSEIMFVHRRLAGSDFYYVDNRKNRAEHVEARFRITGMAPELWRADTGAIETLSYRIEKGVTAVPLDFGPEESFFVVFRKAATSPSLTVSRPAVKPIARLSGPWTVSFQQGRGAPPATLLRSLHSLSEDSNPAIKYFSGIATYKKSFTLPRGVYPGAQLWLDLGTIGDIAEVRVNGRLVGTSWHAPYRLDISKAVRPGANRLDIRVADLWVNRLIGDAQPGAKKITWTALPTYTPDAPLRPSGLIGPVTLAVDSRGRRIRQVRE